MVRRPHLSAGKQDRAGTTRIHECLLYLGSARTEVVRFVSGAVVWRRFWRPAAAHTDWYGQLTKRFLACGRTDAATRLPRPSFKGPPEAGAALPRQKLGRSCPPEAGAARLPQQQPPAGATPAAAPGAATAGAVQEPRTAPARRGSGSCNSGGRIPRERRAAPASGGRLLEAVPARQPGSIRLGRAVAAQEPCRSYSKHRRWRGSTTLVGRRGGGIDFLEQRRTW